MNVYRFIKDFICPYCNKAPNINKVEEHVTATIKMCNCTRTKYYDYPRSEMLSVNYSPNLKVEIAVRANESFFTIRDCSDVNAQLLLEHYNYIPEFYKKKTVEDVIIFLETLVTFK